MPRSLPAPNISTAFLYRFDPHVRYALTPRPHIVVSGDHASELVIFLAEFFHPDHGSNMTDVIIFSYHPPDPIIITKLGMQPQGSLIEFVRDTTLLSIHFCNIQAGAD